MGTTQKFKCHQRAKHAYDVSEWQTERLVGALLSSGILIASRQQEKWVSWKAFNRRVRCICVGCYYCRRRRKPRLYCAIL